MEEQRSLQVPFDGMIRTSSLGGMVVLEACSASTLKLKSRGKQMTGILVKSVTMFTTHGVWCLFETQSRR